MYQRILVPIDGSETSWRGLDEAIALAQLTGGRLRLLHVIDDLSIATGLDACTAVQADVMDALRQQALALTKAAQARVAESGVRADTVVLSSASGRVSECAVRQATEWNADLIVIGTHGRRGFKRLLLGSDAEQLVRAAPVPVLLVRLPAVASPTAAPAAGEPALT